MYDSCPSCRSLIPRGPKGDPGTNGTTIEDSGWVDITFTTGFPHISSGDKPQYRKYGKLLMLRGILRVPPLTVGSPSAMYDSIAPNTSHVTYLTGFPAEGIALVAGSVSANFPVGYRPSKAVRVDVVLTRFTFANTGYPSKVGTDARVKLEAPFVFEIGTDGVIELASIVDAEIPGVEFSDIWRSRSSKWSAGDYVINNNGYMSSLPTSSPANVLISPVASLYRHHQTVDGSRADMIGGYFFRLDGINISID